MPPHQWPFTLRSNAVSARFSDCAYKKTADSGEKGRGRMIDTPFLAKGC
jgi:hypothetical protein